MLRLDPAYPPVWRDVSTLQFGLDPVVVIDEPRPWQLRLVRSLERGIPDDAIDAIAIAVGAEPGAATGFLARLAPAVASPPPAPPHLRVVAADGAEDAARALARALEAGGAQCVPGGEGGHEVTVLVAHHLVEPRHATALMRADRDHVPVVFTGSGAEVGPFVRPGTTPCLSCRTARRRDADPAWPVLASQLLGRPGTMSTDAALVLDAAAAVLGLIGEGVRSASAHHRMLTLRAHSAERISVSVEQHPACGCRSPEGTATADVRDAREPTSPRACARPA
ncbi:hypothetical protein JOD63_000963 [Microbacterium terrae]|uniref:Bacteriocin biosynthesis cyclodehydratase domain-containing protein n=1 Tax=Microbacterium terrae TaxID=69369 RepID=A0A0M2HAV2_9MICO|nr:hypothetical protein RS81_00759 [Microbacterium terrae]KJL43748.1 hypothetical protein RS81_00790 [Microbacterium terrae]MBP1076995.1 hypothetical protein [Microbacterium terrae]